MNESPPELEKLTDEVGSTRELLTGLRSAPETYLLGQALSRQLLFAHETGKALVLALREELIFGTNPLLRNLLESVVEVFLIYAWPPPGGPIEAASRSLAWDLGQWKRRRELLRRTLAEAPEALPGVEAAGARRVEEIVADTCEIIEEEGADPIFFREAWEEFSDCWPSHWSEFRTFADRLEFLEERFPEVERVRAIARRYEFLWSEGSYASHATPRWDLVKMQPGEDGSFQPYHDRSRVGHVEAQAEHGVEFLQLVQYLVKKLTLKIPR